MFKEFDMLKLFFEEPNREFSVREVARLVKVSPATASKQLNELVEKDILKERKERIFNLFKANLESYNYKDLKVYYSIRRLRESGLIDAINKRFLKPTIVLFGSISNGLDTETSDIDIAIISEFHDLEFPEIKEFEKRLNRRIQIFSFHDKMDIKNEHLTNNILNGIVLQGSIKWI